MLQTHQLLATLQRLFLPYEISRATRQKKSAHTLDLSQTRAPSPFLEIYLNTLSSSSPCWGRQALLPLRNSPLLPQKQPLGRASGRRQPSQARRLLLPITRTQGWGGRRPRDPRSHCAEGDDGSCQGAARPCGGRAGGQRGQQPRAAAAPARPSPALLRAPQHQYGARGLRSRGCLRSQEPRRAPC